MLKSGMALKKAYCARCRTTDEKERIFEVNSDAKVCFCPRCMRQYEPVLPINAFDSFINKQIHQADKTLFSGIGYYKAYVMYARVLDYDENNIHALFGRLLSLVYMSTLRKNHFQNVGVLMNKEKDLFRKASNEKFYFTFLNRVCYSLDEYYTLFRKKLVTNYYFHDIDCIKLYFKNLKDIQNLKAIILDEYRYIQSHHEEVDIKLAIAYLEQSMAAQSEEMTKKWITADGHTYGYVGASQSGDLLLGRSDKLNTVKIARHHPKALLPERSKGKTKLIKDEVFPNFVPMFWLKKLSLPFTIALFILSVVGLIFTFVYQASDYKKMLIVLTSIIFALTLVCLTAYLFSLFRLVKRQRLIS